MKQQVFRTILSIAYIAALMLIASSGLFAQQKEIHRRRVILVVPNPERVQGRPVHISDTLWFYQGDNRVGRVEAGEGWKGNYHVVLSDADCRAAPFVVKGKAWVYYGPRHGYYIVDETPLHIKAGRGRIELPLIENGI